jgi:hypothetical protein
MKIALRMALNDPGSAIELVEEWRKRAEQGFAIQARIAPAINHVAELGEGVLLHDSLNEDGHSTGKTSAGIVGQGHVEPDASVRTFQLIPKSANRLKGVR